jgi:hypothetical protein
MNLGSECCPYRKSKIRIFGNISKLYLSAFLSIHKDGITNIFKKIFPPLKENLLPLTSLPEILEADFLK